MKKIDKKFVVAEFISQYLIPTFDYYITDGEMRKEFYNIFHEAEENYRDTINEEKK